MPETSASSLPSAPIKQWTLTKDSQTYQISNDNSLLDHKFINTAYGTDDMFWMKPMNPRDLSTLIQNSYVLGIYNTTSVSLPEMVGFARLVTDRVDFAYVTDVYVRPDSRGKGLGRWLVRCVKEVCEGFPALRRVLLLVEIDVSMSRSMVSSRINAHLETRINEGVREGARDGGRTGGGGRCDYDLDAEEAFLAAVR